MAAVFVSDAPGKRKLEDCDAGDVLSIKRQRVAGCPPASEGKVPFRALIHKYNPVNQAGLEFTAVETNMDSLQTSSSAMKQLQVASNKSKV